MEGKREEHSTALWTDRERSFQDTHTVVVSSSFPLWQSEHSCHIGSGVGRFGLAWGADSCAPAVDA